MRQVAGRPGSTDPGSCSAAVSRVPPVATPGSSAAFWASVPTAASGQRTEAEGLQDRQVRRAAAELVQQHPDLGEAETVAAVGLRQRHSQQSGRRQGVPRGIVAVQRVAGHAADGEHGLGGREVQRVSSEITAWHGGH